MTTADLGDTDELTLADALAQLSFVVQSVLGRVGADEDLSIVQLRLLGILRDRRPTINQLAQVLQLDKSSVTGLIDRAEQRGLVRRAASTVDGRSVHVVITATGKRLADKGTQAFESAIARLVTDLTQAQRSRLVATARSIITADAHHRGTPSAAIPPRA